MNMDNEEALKAAIEIAKARSGSANPINASTVIQDAYDKIVDIATKGGFLSND